MSDIKENETAPITRGRPKGSIDTAPRKKRADHMPMLQEGDNTKITQHNLELMTQPPVDMEDLSQIEERIMWYFRKCVEDDIKPGVAGLCLALHISRQTWQAWGQGTRRKGTYSDIVERSRQLMEAVLEQYMLSGKINPVTGIFLLKNHFGYADKSEVVLTPNNPLGEQKSEEYLRQKYLDNTYGITDEEYPAFQNNSDVSE